MKTGRRKGILIAPMVYNDPRFTRADLVFTGVEHAGGSFEVLVFLNNRSATDTTAHDLDRGYGGRFVVFGHGGCFGDMGHCDVPQTRSADDLRPQHALTPATKIVTITEALQYVLATTTNGLETVTLVPIAQTPRRKDRAITPDLFRFEGVSLRTYLSGTDLDLPADTDQVIAMRELEK
jgi:tyrosinase